MTTTIQIAPAATDAAWCFAEYEQWMQSWGASAATIKVRLDLGRRIARRWADPNDITTQDLTAFLSDARYSAWTRRTYFVSLRSIFGWLHDEGRIVTNPAYKLRSPKVPRDRPRPLSDQEAKRALEAADPTMRVWLLLGLYAGLRAHETAKIASEDVTEQTIYVVGKGGKAAEVPTHPLVWEAAQQFGPGHWFPVRTGRHIASQVLIGRVTEHFRSVGINEGSYHRCRHHYGTHLLRSGVNLRVVQTLMRHSNIATTAAYLAVDENERTSAVHLLGGL